MERSIPAVTTAALELGVQLEAGQVDQLLAHLDILERWNRTHNLVGPGTPELWLERHTLDSLAAAPHLSAGEGYDVGSGAGFPGIPLAVARPDCRLTLVEPREKRAAFLVNAIAALGLGNVTVVRERLEGSRVPDRVQFAVSRATLALPAWLQLAAGLLAPRGITVAFLGIESWEQSRIEAEAHSAGLVEPSLELYQVGGQPARSLALFRHP